jgi:hypothetical protein
MYLVTGGAGFIGSHIVRRLSSMGERVRVLDKFAVGKLENFKALDDKVELIRGDILDQALVEKAMKGVEVVLHQGAHFLRVRVLQGIEILLGPYFSGWKGEPAGGEARHRNLYLPYIPDRIATSMPAAKFIVIVRNPIKRAYSHWLHNYRIGIETLQFEDAIWEDMKRIEKGFTFEGEEGARLWPTDLVVPRGKKGIRTTK